MKRIGMLAAAAALMMVSCAKVNTVGNVATDTTLEALDFGVYVPQTRAGEPGEMDNTKLRSTGFGVIAFEEAGGYSGTIKPNFMYNQEVSYNSTTAKWEYAPIKYWPNQLTDNGVTDGQSATSQNAHMVSFFAYAPYVDNAGGTSGITAMSAKNNTGDPTLSYAVSADLHDHVDLVWGTSNGAVWKNVAGGFNTVEDGLPYINMQKPLLGTNVNFRFYHALAQLNLSAVSSYNIVGAGGDAKDGVKITISDVVLTVPGMYDTGVLNLHNTVAKKPEWDFTAAKDSTFVFDIYDDRLHPDVRDSYTPGDTSTQPVGVIATEGPVLADGEYFTLLPREVSTTVTVKVTYYVTTDDSNLDDGYSRVENIISKQITFPNGFRHGTKNNIRMILGLSEVGLSGEVVDWETNVPIEAYMPKNQ
jgi:hypothetical protein